MKEYDVRITETRQKTITVEAWDEAEARERIREAYDEGEYTLDTSNVTDSEFASVVEREIGEKEWHLTENELTVLLVEPGACPQVVTLPNSDEALRAAVGGDFCTRAVKNDFTCIVLNAKGREKNLEKNRAVKSASGRILDIYYGPFLVAGANTAGKLTSLGQEQIEGYEKFFHQPEAFVRTGTGWISYRLPEERIRNSADVLRQFKTRLAAKLR